MRNAKRVTFGLLAALSLAFVVAASSFGQSTKSEQSASPKKLNQHQINQLIANARTPKDHQRIAEYYQEQAQQYLTQSRDYASKIAAYKRSPYLSSCTMCVSTSYSLEAAVRSLRVSKQLAEDHAAEMLKLAAQHDPMASSAPIPSVGLGL
jgi:hypothetical protein